MTEEEKPDLDLETHAAHAGLRLRLDGIIPTVGPIVASTTFTAESIDDVHRALEPDGGGFAYARNGNPTVVAFEEVVARLEGADQAVAFGSGMGAIQATLMALELAPGDVIVAAKDLYGVTRSLFAHLASYDIETQYVALDDAQALESAVGRREARTLFFETISNPLIHVADVKRMATIGRAHRVAVIVDNTFATPYLCRPLELGADIVIHSATKYLSGHGDVMAGIAAANVSWSNRIRAARTISGSVLSPFEAWLAMRGLRTLSLRVTRQSHSAHKLAGWLDEREWVQSVHYPGLSSCPDFARARGVLGEHSGGMLAFELRGGKEEALAFMDALELITTGTSLGDAESLALYPPLSSHRGLDAEGLRTAGIGEGLIRLSVGLESPRDLIVDLARAASRAGLAEAVASQP